MMTRARRNVYGCRPGRTTLAFGLWALVMIGHLALGDDVRFGLFLGCVVAALVAAADRLQPRAGQSTRRRTPRAVAGSGASGDHDVLRRLEAELHALEDQLDSASVDVAPPWALGAGMGAAARG